MTELEILARVKERADHWEREADSLRILGQSFAAKRVICDMAARDFRRLQRDIEASLEQMAEARGAT